MTYCTVRRPPVERRAAFWVTSRGLGGLSSEGGFVISTRRYGWLSAYRGYGANTHTALCGVGGVKEPVAGFCSETSACGGGGDVDSWPTPVESVSVALWMEAGGLNSASWGRPPARAEKGGWRPCAMNEEVGLP